MLHYATESGNTDFDRSGSQKQLIPRDIAERTQVPGEVQI
jgi:hypothetical protein